jgi:hypothetical protein
VKESWTVSVELSWITRSIELPTGAQLVRTEDSAQVEPGLLAFATRVSGRILPVEVRWIELTCSIRTAESADSFLQWQSAKRSQAQEMVFQSIRPVPRLRKRLLRFGRLFYR